ncbi:hypothetical protein MTR67_012111 [Solanum verrucosum]|uniref:Uncharacterized protein n=1 Tax=Solanum verrucosum TaxID=315347 RepID=A0AAF0TGP7_SOLVR|nr:hypothetical protein MTR67_012111 [Solanum verrucosum]
MLLIVGTRNYVVSSSGSPSTLAPISVSWRLHLLYSLLQGGGGSSQRIDMSCLCLCCFGLPAISSICCPLLVVALPNLLMANQDRTILSF